MSAERPLAVGIGLALLAAAAFGATTPAVKALAGDADPPAVAALLYLGAAGLALPFVATPRHRVEARLTATWWPRVVAVGLSGAFVAPIALAAGLSRTTASTASLLLNLEAVFTVLLGWLVHREPVGTRVATAVSVIALGGVLVGWGAGGDLAVASLLGPMLVAIATLAWATDNVLSRPLSDLDPSDVVAAKGAVGAAASLAVAAATDASFPTVSGALGIAVCGALGFGASLRLYLRAQRVLGAARTGSIFAVAPFLGVFVAWVLGDPVGGWLTVAGGLAMAVGVWLHLGETHDHEHEHPVLTHAHPHRHDDGHHDDHVHDPPIHGWHNHEHTHARRVHAHPHGEDLHHRH